MTLAKIDLRWQVSTGIDLFVPYPAPRFANKRRLSSIGRCHAREPAPLHHLRQSDALAFFADNNGRTGIGRWATRPWPRYRSFTQELQRDIFVVFSLACGSREYRLSAADARDVT